MDKIKSILIEGDRKYFLFMFLFCLIFFSHVFSPTLQYSGNDDPFAEAAKIGKHITSFKPVFFETYGFAGWGKTVSYVIHHILYGIFSNTISIKLSYLILTFMIGAFMFLLLKEFNIDSFVAFLIAVATMFSNHIISIISNSHIGKFETFAFQILTFLFLVKALKTLKLKYFIFTGLSFGWALSDPQISYYFAFLFASFFFMHIYLKYKEDRAFTLKDPKILKRYIAGIVLTAVFTIGIGMQSISFYTGVVKKTQPSKQKRTKEQIAKEEKEKWDFATSWSFPPEDTIEFFMPGFFNGYTNYGYWGRLGESDGWRNFKGTNENLGFLIIAAIVMALVFVRNSYVKFFGIAGLIFLLASFGKYFPLFNLVYKLPFMDKFRVPAKMLYVVVFSFLIMGAFGLNYVLTKLKAEDKRTATYFGFLKILYFAIFIPLIIAIINPIEVLSFKHELVYKFSLLNDPVMANWQYQAMVPYMGILMAMLRLLFFITAVYIVSVFIIYKRVNTKQFIYGTTFVSLLIISTLLFYIMQFGSFPLKDKVWLFSKNTDLGWLNMLLNVTAIAMFIYIIYQFTRAYLKDNGNLNIKSNYIKLILVILIAVDLIPNASKFVHSYNYKQLYKEDALISFLKRDFYKTQEVTPFRVKLASRGGRLNLLATYVFPYHGLECYDIAHSRPPYLYTEFGKKVGVWGEKFFSVFNIKYVLSYGALPPDMASAAGLTPIKNFNNHIIYIYRNYIPRMHIVGKYKIIENDEKMLSYIKSALDPKQEVVIASKDIKGFTTSAGTKGNIKIKEYGDNKIVADVISDGNGILVFSDMYDPRWKAFVDGKETRIYRANFVMQAIPIKSGKHTVVFEYPAMDIPSLITLAFIGGIILYWLYLLYASVRKRKALAK